IEPDPNAELVAELQALRRQLAELRAQQQAQQGQQRQAGPQQGQGGPQQGQQQGGQQAGGQQGGGAQDGGQVAGGPIGPYGVWDPRTRWWNDPQAVDRARELINEAGTNLLTQANRLRAEGLTPEELRAIRELGDALRGSLTGNPELIEAELQRLMSLTEKLEL